MPKVVTIVVLVAGTEQQEAEVVKAIEERLDWIKTGAHDLGDVVLDCAIDADHEIKDYPRVVDEGGIATCPHCKTASLEFDEVFDYWECQNEDCQRTYMNHGETIIGPLNRPE